jgi:hypothetical protein
VFDLQDRGGVDCSSSPALRTGGFLPSLIESLERFGHLQISETVKEQLLSLSAATADRLLKPERRKYGKSKSTTKPGKLIRKHVPIRTFADWNDVIPGFMEGDLVAHCGEHIQGRSLCPFVSIMYETKYQTEFSVIPREKPAA